MSHDPLRDLRSDTCAGELRAQRGAQGVKIDHPALFVFNRDPRLDPLPLALANLHGLAVLVEDVDPARDARPQEVLQTREIPHRRRPHRGSRYRGGVLQPPTQRVRELWVHRDRVDPPGFAMAERERSVLEVNVCPRQPAEIALAQPCENRGEVPRVAPMLSGDRDQPGQFRVCERAAHAAPIARLILAGNHAQRVGLCPSGLDAPGVERDRDLSGEVDRAGGQFAVLEGRQVAQQRIGGEFREAGGLRAGRHGFELRPLLVDVMRRLPGVGALRDVRHDVFGERLASLGGEAVVARVDDALLAEAIIADQLR